LGRQLGGVRGRQHPYPLPIIQRGGEGRRVRGEG